MKQDRSSHRQLFIMGCYNCFKLFQITSFTLHAFNENIVSKAGTSNFSNFCSGQRVQVTLQTIKISDIHILPDRIIIPITTKIKQTRPNHHIKPLEFKLYQNNEKLCVMNHLLWYLQKTKPMRKCDNLFISYVKPHKNVSRDTISRWCKNMLEEAGINTSIFKAHSTRSAFLLLNVVKVEYL